MLEETVNENFSTVNSFIVNPLLCFVSSALNTKTTNEITSYCAQFFSYNDVIELKQILYNHTGDRNSKHRGDDKLVSEIKDIMEIIRKYNNH